MLMAKIRRIAILMGQDLSFCRQVIRGVRAYAIHKPHWSFRSSAPDMNIIRSLREWNPDGIITELYSLSFARKILAMNKPVIDTAFWLPKLNVSVIDVDHTEVGRMAAEYFLSLGFSNFAFFGSAKAEYSRIREQAFLKRLFAAGHSAMVSHKDYIRELPSTMSWKKMESHTRQWLRSLPKPVALFASNDILARSLADTCIQLNLNVPTDVALLGVDNDELECELTSPPLSSIAIPGERIGYEAAKQLDQAMSSKKFSPQRIFLPPIRIVQRQSTETIAVQDSTVIAALTYIRAHSAEGINVANVIRSIGSGRRELERKFRSILGRSVLQEIRSARIHQVQKLLTDTDLPMPAIAKLTGFSSAHRLAIVFHRTCGLPPTAYRKQSQIRDV
jgi:LacI family transcriptional regulator